MPEHNTQQPGDVIGLVTSLRQLMSGFETSGHLLDGSFAQLSPELEERAATARPLVQAASNALYKFLETLERTPEYVAQKKARST